MWPLHWGQAQGPSISPSCPMSDGLGSRAPNTCHLLGMTALVPRFNSFLNLDTFLYKFNRWELYETPHRKKIEKKTKLSIVPLHIAS